jgi:antitoxin CptB
MTKPDDDLDLRRRRAVWRAGHRGMRELDLVLGAYARAHVPGMGDDALAHFESILAAADTDLFDWVMGTAPVPVQYQGPVIDALRQSRFKPESYHGG